MQNAVNQCKREKPRFNKFLQFSPKIASPTCVFVHQNADCFKKNSLELSEFQAIALIFNYLQRSGRDSKDVHMSSVWFCSVAYKKLINNN